MKITRYCLAALLAITGTMTLYGCPKSTEVSSAPESQPQKVETAPAAPAVDAGKSAEAAAKAAQEEKAREAAARSASGLQPIYFDFDKAAIRDDAKAVMKANANYLKANPKVKVQIEGNCDERGTIEYNQALGQRRAASAKKYLADLGISAKRISLISYGKEKPVCGSSDEDCWQKNRRDDFVEH
jgi:peptidoglycan-associated lipoprotein